jgi:hypothetical protein
MKVLLVLCLLAVVVSANPYVITVLNEVGCSNDSLHWFELHFGPYEQNTTDLTGTIVRTSTSECTLECYLGGDEHLVITSDDLALGVNGRGTFRILPERDSISVVFPESLYLQDEYVEYPAYPTGEGAAPPPPFPGSIALWSHPDYERQSINWYVDSTPTSGGENDDHSSIVGNLICNGGGRIWESAVHASGRFGRDLIETCRGAYTLSGLGPGRYQVDAYVYCDSGEFWEAYPESVLVGYSDTVFGIDFDLSPVGIAEPSLAASVRPMLHAIGRVVRLSLDRAEQVRLDVHDVLGRRTALLTDGMLAAGEHRFRLPEQLSAGAYVVRLEHDGQVASVRAVVVR